jgi:hypothetical protein
VHDASAATTDPKATIRPTIDIRKYTVGERRVPRAQNVVRDESGRTLLGQSAGSHEG